MPGKKEKRIQKGKIKERPIIPNWGKKVNDDLKEKET